MRILLSEGSGLTSRQVAGRLGLLGHEVEILSSSKLCLARFTRHVRVVHEVPRFGLDPFGWLAAAERIAGERKADLLFPTQEQVTVLSARQKHLQLATIVPPFASLARVQDKISAFRTLQAIGVPQPPTFVLSGADDLRTVAAYPVFVKRPVSTASSGVRRVTSARELEAAAREFGLGSSELIAQSQASGPLAMVQAVADRGRLVAHHACLRIREGVGGGASVKESIALPGLADMLARLVAALDWHGGLSMDVIVAEREPVIIDVNPRLVEPANALAAGVDLVAAMLDVASDAPARARPPSGAGIRTRQTLLAILGAAQHHGTRGAVLREAYDAAFARGAYVGAVEELTPVAGDPVAAVPVVTALVASLIHPPLWRKFHAGAVGLYAVTPEAWNEIRAAAAAE
ncbi:MAG: ATP-grasp domain-containing protein [Bradyrhizobium sp.]|uniref:ATP-grasp domain-containing protein n=1 Tax=Bradyrhizobium sp. TaxID=376 RepID=UPI001D5A9F7D|nr:ATP-grasp domain-containing protein [Bradyrhizobium sp.]MBV9560137.1 ATP-grasp domain-containing protein [Bradyrhizobium sp.]